MTEKGRYNAPDKDALRINGSEGGKKRKSEPNYNRTNDDTIGTNKSRS